MRKHRTIPLLLLPAVLACASGGAGAGGTPRAEGPPPLPSGMRLAGYLFSRSPQVIGGVRGDRLTHVIYSFARIAADCSAATPERCVAILGNPCAEVGRCADTARAPAAATAFDALRDLKRRHPHLRLLVAVGGWSWSEKFSDAALSDSSRRVFARSAVDLFVTGQNGLFDGVDIDWEYPVHGGALRGTCGPDKPQTCRPEDRRNFTLLMRELRRALDAQGARDGRRYELTTAIPAGRGAVTYFELDSVAAVSDWINVMTYDYHGAGRTGFNSPLFTAAGDPTPTFNIDSTVAMYVAAGVPRPKIVIGVPFYGRMYRDVADANNGLFQTAPGSVESVAYNGVGRLLADTAYRRCRHGESRVPWLWSPSQRRWVTYEDTESVREKGAYAASRRLGGAMIWQLGSDTTGALLDALRGGLSGTGGDPAPARTTGCDGNESRR